MLSAPDVSLHAQFEFVIFRTSWSKMRINGSFIRAAFFVLRTPRKGRMLRIAFYARQPHQVYVRGLPAGMIVREDAPLTKLEGVTISLQKKTLTVVTEKWRMSAESTIAYPTSCG
jgi:hypothetical protein